MMNQFRVSLTTVTLSSLILITCINVPAQRRSVRRGAEQILFTTETPVRRPVRLPNDVLDQLVKENGEQLQRCRESDRSGGTDFRGYFQASELDVNGDGRRDLIVQATSCLIGAHSAPFWIFTNSNQRLLPGYERVFMKQADYLKVLRT